MSAITDSRQSGFLRDTTLCFTICSFVTTGATVATADIGHGLIGEKITLLEFRKE